MASKLVFWLILTRDFYWSVLLRFFSVCHGQILHPEQRSHSSSSKAAPKVPAGQWRGRVLSLRRGPLALASAVNGWGSIVISDEGRNKNSNSGLDTSLTERNPPLTTK